jgi:hypothetical protein
LKQRRIAVKNRESNTGNDRVLNVFIDVELKDALKREAQANDCTVAQVVRLLLRMALPLLEGVTRSRRIMLSEQLTHFRGKDPAAGGFVTATTYREEGRPATGGREAG